LNLNSPAANNVLACHKIVFVYFKLELSQMEACCMLANWLVQSVWLEKPWNCLGIPCCQYSAVKQTTNHIVDVCLIMKFF